MHELVEFMYGEHKVHEWYQYDGRPYTFRVEIMGIDVLITDEGMESFLSALQKVKNTRSLLEAIIFHREINLQTYSGVAVASYSRQVIVDFFSEKKKDVINMHSGTQQAHYYRQAVVDHFKDRVTVQQQILSGVAPAYILKQTIKEG